MRFALSFHHNSYPDLGHCGIMLEIGPSLKSYWINVFPILTGCCNYFSSIGLGTRTSCDYSSTGCCNSPSSTGLDAGTNYEISSTIG
jgi:hypothetical protein